MAIQTYKKAQLHDRLSKNFKASEFACKCGCGKALVDEALVSIVQDIRSHFGCPITVTSGYRCPTHNKAVGGSTGSYHTKGQAADIVVQGVTPREVAKYAESKGVKGIGLYETAADGSFVHVDTRTAKSFWYGQKQSYRSTFGRVAQPATDTYSKTEFIKDIQRACGVTVSGKADEALLSSTVTLNSTKKRKHETVRAVQKRLNALGYKAGTPDGIAGPLFTEAVRNFQRDNKCLADGVITAGQKTWRKLLGVN